MEIKKPEMPNIRERANPSGKKNYFLDYFDPWENKRKRIVIGHRIAHARQKASQLYSEMMDRWTGVPTKQITEMSLVDLIVMFSREKQDRTRPSTVSRYSIYAEHLKAFMEKYFPDLKNVLEIKKIYLEEHLSDLFKQGKKPKTVNGHLQFLRALFNYALEEGLILDNPAKKIKRFPIPKDIQVEYWTKEEIQDILKTVHPHYRDHFSFFYVTGLRKSELINLTWNDVNLKKNASIIAIQGDESWRTKTNERRIIPLNDEAERIIRKQTKAESHNYIFKSVQGMKLGKNILYDVLQIALTKLGLEGNIHKFRHTFASHLVMTGVGLETVSKLLGHTSIEITQQYAHLAPDHLRDAVNLLE